MPARIAALGVAAAALAALALTSAASAVDPDEGRSERPAWEKVLAVPATFLRDSYGPGQVARFVLWRREPGFTLQLFRVDPSAKGWGRAAMQGTPVSRVYSYGPTEAHVPISLRLGSWPTGLYYAQLRSAGLRGYAVFVIHPWRLGIHRVLVVLPTFTWQAYNFRDDNHDGLGDTWYASSAINHVRLDRPFLARGVPPHFTSYDLPFLEWLQTTGEQADFMSDTDLAGIYRPEQLHHAYSLIVFPGHHEYVTLHEYAMVTGYRNLGGHLMFLSGNDFFWKVVRTGDIITRRYRWRRLGLPEAALIGVQFFRNDGGTNKGPWRVVDMKRWPWLWTGTDVHVGSPFGLGGIEIDHMTRSSPKGTHVIADIPNLMGRGNTAQMTYYERPSGAKVFAAGAFTLGGAHDPVECRLLENLWNHLGPPTREPVDASRPDLCN